jgi:hypothetical protein
MGASLEKDSASQPYREPAPALPYGMGKNAGESQLEKKERE